MWDPHFPLVYNSTHFAKYENNIHYHGTEIRLIFIQLFKCYLSYVTTDDQSFV